MMRAYDSVSRRKRNRHLDPYPSHVLKRIQRPTTEIDEEKAYIIVYDGRVWPRSKDFGPDYLGFRCVKHP